MLDAPDAWQAASRRSFPIALTFELDGLAVRFAATQG
jgi:hypothetical protein